MPDIKAKKLSIEVTYNEPKNILNPIVDLGTGFNAMGFTQVSQGLQSNNYTSGSTGWKIHEDGSSEFQSVTISGYVPTGGSANDVNTNVTKINGGSITANSITATQIAAGTLTANEITVSTLSALSSNMGSITAGDIVVGTTNKLWLNDASDGALNIGGIVKASAPFRVTSAGDLTATSATIAGNVTINSGTGVANLTDAGSLAVLNTVGTAQIDALAVNDTKIASNAVTTAKIALGAVGSNEIAAGAIIAGKITAGTIVSADIATGTIVAGNIAAGTITANEMTVSQLSAISADLGTITAGSITMPSGGFIKSGQTAYDTGTGFYLGNDAGTQKFSIGDSNNSLTWDGDSLNVKGLVQKGLSYARGWLSDNSANVISGSGAVSKALMSTSLQTGATANSKATIHSIVSALGMFGAFSPTETLNADIRFQCSALQYNTISVGAGPISFIGLSNIVPVTTTSTAFTAHHIGWYIVYQVSGLPKIYATNANGTSQTITDSGVRISNTSFTSLRIEKTGSSSIKFYIDNVLVVTHTTNISNLSAAYYVTASSANNAKTSESGLGFGNYDLVSV